MMTKLWQRLTLSFLAVTLLVLAAVAVIVRVSIESSFAEYVNVSNRARFGGDLVADLEAYYAENGSWQGVEALLPGRGGGQGSGAGGGQGAQAFITDAEGVIIAATQPDLIGQMQDSIGQSRQIDLHLNGRVVGSLGEQTPGTVALIEAETRFISEISRGLIVTGIVAALVTVVFGIALSYTLTRPLQALTDRIAGWRLRDDPPPVTVDGTDEVRRLATAFNALAERLADGEARRQRMSADVAHELRTPVTVMRGHMEAMMDGVYPLDTAHLAVAYNQVLHLARLVEDLRLLTLTDGGRLPLNPSYFDVVPFIETAIERFSPLTDDSNIQIVADLPTPPVTVHADAHRVQQVIDNLLSNAVRHTSTGGKIHLLVAAGNPVTVSITNQSATPLDAEQVAHLFDRFWRGEDARQRDTGGSGLGLTITRGLLRAQGGDIHAEATSDGLRITFTLPV